MRILRERSEDLASYELMAIASLPKRYRPTMDDDEAVCINSLSSLRSIEKIEAHIRQLVPSDKAE